MTSAYCSPADFPLTGVNPLALVNVDPSQMVAACNTANDLADSWGFRGRYGNQTPVLLSWGSDVTFMCAKLAVAITMGVRGYKPDAGGDEIFQQFWNMAEDWFKGIARQNVHPNVTPNVQMNTNSGPDLPQVRTDLPRGYQQFTSSGRPSVS